LGAFSPQKCLKELYKFFSQEIQLAIKNEEFYSDINSIEKLKKLPQKRYKPKTFMVNSKVKNTTFSLLFCKTFFVENFCSFSADLNFRYPFEFFSKKCLALSGSSEAGHVQNGSKWKKPLISMF
jgi:hypothetical protein